MSRPNMMPFWLLAGSLLASSVMMQSPAYAITGIQDLMSPAATVAPAAQPTAPTSMVQRIQQDALENNANDDEPGNAAAAPPQAATMMLSQAAKAKETNTKVLTALINALSREVSTLQNTQEQKADREDLAILNQLNEALKGQVAALQVETNSIKGQVQFAGAKDDEQDTRLKLLEKVQVHGDWSFGFLHDIASKGLGSGNQRGIRPATSAVGRLRLTVDVPVVEDKEDSVLGAGTFSARLIAAFGRYSPSSGQHNNLGANYPLSLYSRVSADVSATNEGLGTGSVGNLFNLNGNILMTRPNIYLESAFYKQHLKQGIPLLTSNPLSKRGKGWETSADVTAGIARWWDFFDVSPYRGNEQTQFQNISLINIPGIAVNNNMPMLAYQLHQGLGEHASLDFTTGLGAVDVGDVMSGLNLTYEGKLNYTTAFLGESFNKPGSVYLGAYHAFDAGAKSLGRLISSLPNRDTTTTYPQTGRDNVHAVYAGWNQEWWRGIGTNIGYLYNLNHSSTLASMLTNQPGPATVAAAIRQGFTSSVTIPTKAIKEGFRPNDAIGLGYAFINPYNGGFSQDAYEWVVEGFYRYQVNDSFSIIPSYQVIGNRLGLRANGLASVLSLRMSHSF